MSRVGSPVQDRRRRVVGRHVHGATADRTDEALWFEITVPSMALGSTTTSNTIVATLSSVLDASAGIDPGVASNGALIGRPATSGEVPPTSGTGVPFSVVLPAT